MKTNSNIYENIDKSTHLIFNEKNTFKVFHFNNLSVETSNYQYHLNTNYIQLFFCINQHATVAFNQLHCAVNIGEHSSSMVYFKTEEMKLYFSLPPKTELITVLISIDHFHSLFAEADNFLFNFKNFNVGKPIIETKKTNNSVKLILHQIVNQPLSDALKPVFIKGKIYELLSYYFTTITEENSDHCPYVPTDDVAGKVKLAKEIVIENLANPPSLEQLAKQVGLNIKKLKTDFKEFYGVPVFTFLLNYKMEQAKKLLLEQQLNVNEIATYLGYSTSSHFIAAFKKKYGITPKQYAKQ